MSFYLIKILSEWPRIVEIAAKSYEPHRIAYYLQFLASQFHSLWNKGKENAELRFIFKENKEKTQARLALIRACSIVIKSGLSLFTVTPREEMR